ncbi:MAG TPA: DPP IV N-terminal domain-containing protein [Phnomibacter sp.]|nr:DPP IV N-terminal domain-containing protein [Phnomibacter sp.]
MKKKLLITAVLLSGICGAYAQGGAKQLTAEDYKKAEQMLMSNTSKLVYRNGVNAQWLPDGQFYYTANTEAGEEIVLVNAADGTRKILKSRSEIPGGAAPAQNTRMRGAGREVLSPDGKMAVFIKDWNLWLKEIASGKLTQLTTDGVKDFGYATDNAGWTHSERPVVLWSPDSKKIVTFQQDDRGVKDMYLVKTKVGSPELQQWKYPMAGDSVVSKIYRVIIEVAPAKIIRLHMGADAHRSTECDDISCDGGFTDNSWSADSKQLAFVSTSRDHKSATLRLADAASGEVREVYNETVATQYESGQGAVNWKFLPARNEFIWYSEKDDWGHLYLHDLGTGKLKHQITKGKFVVSRILYIDEANGLIYFEGKGKEAGRNPYFAHVYSVKMDGSALTLLTPEDGNHNISFSPDKKYFVDNYSQPSVPTVSVLRSAAGKLIATLEKADVSKLLATGWKAPQQITVKSDNGQWDLYGLMFVPSKMEPGRKYPIVNYIYPGPQVGSVGSWNFSPSVRDNQALAELGFVVVAIEGSCNPNRSKSFHDACYGSLAVNTLPDQVSGMKQLAARFPFIDLTRVGIWGHSGGGSATTAALFRYPDFFKVGIAESGNHDNRNYEDDWAERYVGLEQKMPNGKTNYDADAVAQYAGNLKGKLLLAHGGMDDNVPPYHTYLVVDALVKANKTFDLLIFPNARHGFGKDTNYMMRRRWDYFVQYLLGAIPPENYKIGGSR